jgi:hypothetical protein
VANPKNWNNTTPAAPSDGVNVRFQADAPDPNPSVSRNVSANLKKATATTPGAVPTPPNDATQFLDGTANFDTVKDSDLSLSAITTNDVSTTKHGFAPTLPNDATKFLNGTGNYTVPAGGVSSSLLFAAAWKRFSYTVVTGASGLSSSSSIGDTVTEVAVVNSRVTPTSSHGTVTEYSDGSADTYALVRGSANNYLYGKNLNMVAGVVLYRTTDVRHWIGLFNSTTVANSDTTPTSQYAAFRFSAIGGDTHWICCTRDGTTQATADSGVTPDTNEHEFGIQCDDTGGKVNFYIDGALVATISTHLPAANTTINTFVGGLWHTTQPNPQFGVAYFGVQSDW